jgi:hypothetical protein
MIFNLLVFLIFTISTVASQELPCLLEREVSPQEIGIVNRYINQCSQEHLTFLNNKDSELLFNILGKDEVQIKLSNIFPDLFLSISCKEVDEKKLCLLSAPILNFGQPIMGMGDYDPNYWMAKFHSQFFLRDGQYIFSPKQEYIVSISTGASEIISAFNQLVFNFEVLDQNNYASVSISCEDILGDGSGPICRIIF